MSVFILSKTIVTKTVKNPNFSDYRATLKKMKTSYRRNSLECSCSTTKFLSIDASENHSHTGRGVFGFLINENQIRDFFQNEMVKFRILFSKKPNSLHLSLDQSPQNDVVLDDLDWFFQVDKTTLFYRFPCRLVFAIYEAN